MHYEAVLFDLDDTLYPYEPAAATARAAAFERARELGYEFDRSTFADLYETGRRETKRELSGVAATHGRHNYFKRGLELVTGESRPADALALGDAYWDAFLDAMEPAPELSATLTAIRDAGAAVGITTNLTTRIQLRKLSRLGIAATVDTLVTSEEVGREKPGSAMFTVPLARLDCAPSEAVVVGDNVTADVGGGNAVGLDTVLLDRDGSVDTDDLPERHCPDHTVDALAAVREVVA